MTGRSVISAIQRRWVRHPCSAGYPDRIDLGQRPPGFDRRALGLPQQPVEARGARATQVLGSRVQEIPLGGVHRFGSLVRVLGAENDGADRDRQDGSLDPVAVDPLAEVGSSLVLDDRNLCGLHMLCQLGVSRRGWEGDGGLTASVRPHGSCK